MNMQPDFEKANEIYFRLGIIYKQQQKYEQSLEVRLFACVLRSRNTDLLEVLQIYRLQSSKTLNRGRHMVPSWSRA